MPQNLDGVQREKERIAFEKECRHCLFIDASALLRFPCKYFEDGACDDLEECPRKKDSLCHQVMGRIF